MQAYICTVREVSRVGKEGREKEGKQGNMSAEILSSPPSSASGIGAWLSDLEGRLRYQPWWIYLTTLDRRLNSILDALSLA